MERFENKVVFLTGGATGIGEATAKDGKRGRFTLSRRCRQK